MGQSLKKTDFQFLKKLSKKVPYNPVIILLGIHPGETKTHAPTKTHEHIETRKCSQKLYSQ